MHEGGFRLLRKSPKKEESPKSMTIPLITLAVLSVIGGFLNIPHLFGGNSAFQEFLAPVYGTTYSEAMSTTVSSTAELMLMSITVAGALLMILFAWYKFVKKDTIPVANEAHRNFLANLLYRKFYIDELYQGMIIMPIGWLSVQFHRADRRLIDSLVNSAGNFTVWTGSKIRLIQTGSIGFYLFVMVLGIIVFIFYAFLI